MKSSKISEMKLQFPPQKKVESKKIVFLTQLFEKEKMDQLTKGDDELTLKKATLSAMTSPYLRAVVMIGESDSHYYVGAICSEEEKLDLDEMVGVLINAGEDAIPIKEDKNVYFIKPESLVKLLYDDVEHYHLKNLTLANVHHDYVRYFGETGSLKEVVSFQLLHNGFAQVRKVIRTT